MSKNIKKICLILAGVLLVVIWWTIFTSTSPEVFANPPDFNNNFANYMLGNKWSEKTETVWDLGWIGVNKNNSLDDNIKQMFYPSNTWQWGRIRDIVKLLGLVVFVVMIVVQWFQYVINADDASKISWVHSNFSYIFLWGIIFFTATWILGIGLNIAWTGWSSELMKNIDQRLMFQIFSWLRAWAFFTAIVLLIYTGWKMMSAMDSEEKFKAWKQGILNILIPLVLIKIIDYIYYIAQTPDFQSKATTLIIEISKVLWYILGAFFTVMIIYYWFRLMFGGTKEQLEKVKSIIVAVFLWSLVVFMFLLIVYQIAQEFIS